MDEKIRGITLEQASSVPLYQQLAEALAGLIADGSLPADSKLPPIRKMASHFGVNSVTIVAAYKYLEQKRMVYSRVGSGTYISPLPVEQVPAPIARKNMALFERTPAMENAINFTLTSLPNELFPVDAFKKAFDAVLEREKGGAFRYTDSMGYFPLRQELCRYLASFGIHTEEDAIQVISGAQQGIDIMSKAVLRYGDVVFVEKPTFYGAAGAFLSRGTKLIEIPMETDGMAMTALEDYLKLYHPRFIYMMAYFQTPTGISYSMEKKRRLLELAEKYDTYIIEEDDFYDFHYGKEHPLPLKALDYKNRVVYIKSFSKILMPGLRMGLMVLPKKIRMAVQEAKYTTDISTSGFIQKALEEYLRINGWELHGKQVRQYGSGKYRKAVSMAKKYLTPKGASFALPEGGVSLWVRLPDGVDAEVFCNRALEKNVLVSPGSQFSLGQEGSSHIRLSFAGLSDDKIEVGMKRLGDVLEEMRP
ncbi:PLP-dependent aminotransferase family protein [Anaerotignum lactatifermentans]|uniref:PLP-dependent aminotransferase family protein n=1 Tax=Anaerotignum lactatifermentans TaxID=160404 RepID=A0ABS2GAA0_9FIRM|nr:PLP-dependent aminotransferase family protein [Anaerotignum lactatifermentans]MBM6829918.1 PLP-dependent aminotransferase family protein [Anaerotignum lactatifermentans]MBM6878421.1 PLP-dependent aminotransferase family protein [Anaerotignum lactatifermentans]MBM6951575.1 PLP-dependent aminotransferase family protein [Anaerotignum lactatifermentans]